MFDVVGDPRCNLRVRQNTSLGAQLALSLPSTEGVSPLDKVEQRQKALFAAIKLVWGSEPVA